MNYTASMKLVLFPELSTELANRDSYTCHWNSFSDAGILYLLQELCVSCKNSLSAAGIMCLLQEFFVFCWNPLSSAGVFCLLQEFFFCCKNYFSLLKEFCKNADSVFKGSMIIEWCQYWLNICTELSLFFLCHPCFISWTLLYC